MHVFLFHHLRLVPPAPHFHPSISSAIKNTAVGALCGVLQAIQTQGRSPISGDAQVPPLTTLTNSRDNTCHMQLSHLHLCDWCTLLSSAVRRSARDRISCSWAWIETKSLWLILCRTTASRLIGVFHGQDVQIVDSYNEYFYTHYLNC